MQDEIVFYFNGGEGLVGSFPYLRNEEGVVLLMNDVISHHEFSDVIFLE